MKSKFEHPHNTINFNSSQAKSARDAKEFLANEITQFLAITKQVILYIDTIGIAFAEEPSPEMLKEMRIISGNAGIHCTRNLKSRYWEIEVNQPNLATLKALETTPGHHVINKLHIAVDFIPNDPADVPRLHTSLKRRLTMRWRGKKREVGKCESTIYSAAIHSTRNFALYSDRNSKKTMETCVHWELRWGTAATCKNLGVSRAGDLLQFDPIPAITRQFRLSRLFMKPVIASLKTKNKAKAKAERLMGFRLRYYWKWKDGDASPPPPVREAENTLPMQEWLDSCRAWPEVAEGAIHLPVECILLPRIVSPNLTIQP
jgi:hypothetical protein